MSNEHAYSYPSDDRIAKWMQEHGTTGVKMYDLEHHANANCVAVYREMAMAERQMLARLADMEEEHPGAYDYKRMIVSTCLLHPTIDDYPKPAVAAAELFGRISVHGHAPLDEEEEMITEDKDLGALPEHVANDFRKARRVAYDSFHNPKFGSVYRDLIVELASNQDGDINPQTLDYLWNQSPGKIRDIAGRVEQVHADIRREAISFLHKNSDMDADERKQRAKMIEDNFASPLEIIDEVAGDAVVPVSDDEEDEDEESTPDTKQTTAKEDDSGLPPNRPPSQDEREDLDKKLKEIIQNG